MIRFSFLIVSLLLTRSLGQDLNVSPRKHNIISRFLNQMLDSLFDELRTNLSIPLVDLGENVGKITNVEGVILGDLEKRVDGYKSFGFTLDTNATKIQLVGYYDIQNLDIPGLFPIYGKGNFSISVEAINLNLWVKALYNSAEEKFDFTIPKFNVSVQNSTVKFDNLMEDPSVADFLNELISNLIPDLAKIISPPASKLLQEFLDFYGNGIFNCIKKEPTTEKIEECIKNLFPTHVAAKLPSTKIVEMLPYKTATQRVRQEIGTKSLKLKVL